MRLRSFLATVALVVTALTAAASAPAGTVACSCVIYRNFAERVADQPDGVVVVGQVLALRGDGSNDFAVARWYGGSDRRPQVVLWSGGSVVDGVMASTSCATGIRPGQALVFFGSVQATTYQVGYCSLMADPRTPAGQDLEADAAAHFGPAEEPRPADGQPRPSPMGSPRPLDATLAAVGLLGAVLAMTLLAVALGIRRRDRRT
jgi:hypothetical protein